VDQRHLHRLVDRAEAFRLQPLGHRLLEPQHELGLGSGRARGWNGRGIRRRDPVGPGRAALADVLHGDVFEGVGPPPGIEQVGGDQRVEGKARDARAQPLEHDAVALWPRRCTRSSRAAGQPAAIVSARGACGNRLGVSSGT
jgi:hypothetical protein